MHRTALIGRLLLVYSGVLTIVSWVVLATGAETKTSFDEIDVQRINVIERRSAVAVIDQPEIPMNPITDALLRSPAQREARLEELFSKNQSQKRIYMGRNPDQSGALQRKGVHKVAAVFLAELGNLTRQLPKESR